jgi:tripartite-type tricarboxylate transporter receptor subunit TctC
MRVAEIAQAGGYTLLFGSSFAIGPALYKNAGYDPVTTFEPVAMISSVPFILVVRPDLPVKSVQELIAYQRALPGKLSFGAPNGTPPFLLIDLFKKKTNTDVVVIPYKGAAPMITDLLGSQLDAMLETTSVILSYVRDSKVRALAVANPTRLQDLPDVPTMAESGVSDFIANSWTGIVAPVGTPSDIVGKLNVAVNASLRSPALQASFARLSVEAKIGTPQQFAAFIARERQRWSEWVRLSGAQAD